MLKIPSSGQGGGLAAGRVACLRRAIPLSQRESFDKLRRRGAFESY